MQKFDFRMIGRLGGRKTSKRKKLTSARNGKLGGRPKIYPDCPYDSRHRFTDDVCRYCGFSRVEILA